MSNFRRRLMMSFEKKYTPVKYLESTGTQYINTNYYADKNTNAQYKVSVLEYKAFGPHLLSGKNYFFPFYRKFKNSLVATRGGEQLQLNGVDFSENTIYEYKAYWNNEIYVNGKKVGELSDFGEKDGQPLYIGAYGGDPNNSSYKSKFRIYYYKIFDGNKLVRNYIPVIDSSGRPCLYDKVEDKFYYNEGSGEFLYE